MKTTRAIRSSVLMLRGLVLTLLLFVAQVHAHDVPAGKSETPQRPNLGVARTDAIQYLGDFQFTETLEANGLTRLEGSIERGKIRIVFKFADAKLIGGMIVVPDSSQPELVVAKSAYLVRFMLNTVPEVDWNDPKNSGTLGEAVGRVSRDSANGLGRSIGNKYLAVRHDPRNLQVKFLVFNSSLDLGTVGVF